VIVPKHDLVWGELGVGAAADQCKDIASKEHLDNANAALKVYTNLLCVATYF
jgi:hypothetical protein